MKFRAFGIALGLASACLFSSVQVLAADISGKWQAKVVLGNNTGEPTFVFIQADGKLSGTYTGTFGDAPLAGTISDADVQFGFDTAFGHAAYKGKVDADGKSMSGTVAYGDQMSGTFTAIRK